jgi:hypothetical protein
MTYKDQFVAEVKSCGKILRVRDGFVYLPFGSEYSILLKNLNSKRAAIRISIDGQDVLSSHRLILEPNETTELKGFMSGNTATHAFKFIQKTKQIQDYRGDRLDDGLIRIEFSFEKPLPEPQITKVITEVHHRYDYPHFPYRQINVYGGPHWVHHDSVSYGGATGQSVGSENVTAYNSSVNELGVHSSFMPDNTPLQNEGVTVHGSHVYQSFNYTSIGELEKAEVIIIQLKGSNIEGVSIEKPITVEQKIICQTCGNNIKSSHKFCSNCGTSVTF